MIIVGGMGSLLGALLGAAFITLFPYVIEGALLALPGAQRFAGLLFAVNYAAFGLVMILFLLFEPLGLVGIWHRAQNYFLLWPYRHRPPPEGDDDAARCPTSSKSSITAASPRCRASRFAVRPAQIVALLGTNGAGKTTTLRAISGFLGLDDARVTQGAIMFDGERIENRPPHQNTRRGIVLVPERDKVFPNLTVAENLVAPVPRGINAAEQRRREALVYRSFPSLRELRDRIGGLLSGGERQMLALGERHRLRAAIATGRRAFARLGAGRGERFAARLVEIRRELGIAILIVEQSAAVAWKSRTTATSWRTAKSCSTAPQSGCAAIPTFRNSTSGAERRRRSYREVKQYRRRRRWYG